jgi:hypothetical protein
MWWLMLVAWAAPPGTVQAARFPLDVSLLKIGTPVIVTEIDTGRLKGAVRRLAWAPDGKELYLQTAEGTAPALVLHHYTIELDSGTLEPDDIEPTWAAAYWTWKQDRVAPGVPSLVIDVEQKQEIVRAGTGPAGVLDRESSPEKVLPGDIDNLAKGTHGDQKVLVVRLRLLGEQVGMWANEPFNAGMKFGWGPSGSGAIAHVDDGGRLVLFDQQKHRQIVAGVKDAVLPAWSADGARLAYLQKTGRKKFAVAWVSLTLR